LDGKTWALRQVPCAAVVSLDAKLAIVAGSEIDMAVLVMEVAQLDNAGYRVSDRLVVDRQATVIAPSDHTTEAHDKLTERIGSTGKGVGAARAARVMRQATLYGGEDDTAALLGGWLRSGGDVIIEGTQGYALGLHAGWYPFCTSSDCRAQDFLAMAGLAAWEASEVEVWMAVRTYPIRVAGNSGPMRNETSWVALNLPPEHTTVTKKVRRVGAWDAQLVKQAVRANGGAPTVRLALMMADYWWPELAGATEEGAVGAYGRDVLSRIEQDARAKIELIGTGPSSVVWMGDGHG